MGKKSILLNIDINLYLAVKQLAEKDDRSVTYTIKKILEKEVLNNE